MKTRISFEKKHFAGFSEPDGQEQILLWQPGTVLQGLVRHHPELGAPGRMP